MKKLKALSKLFIPGFLSTMGRPPKSPGGGLEKERNAALVYTNPPTGGRCSISMQLSIILIALSLNSVSIAGDTIAADLNLVENTYRFMISVVINKEFEHIQYLRTQMVLLEIEKDKLRNKRSFSVSPSVVTSPQGKVSVVCDGLMNVNDFLFDFTTAIFDAEYDNNARFLVPLLSSRKNKIRIMEEILALEIQKSSIETEMVVFNELQNMLIRFIGLKRIHEEIELRKALSVKTADILRLLTQLQDNGVISKRALSSIQFLYDNNLLSIELLHKRSAITENRIMDEYIIDAGHILAKYDGVETVIALIEQKECMALVDNSTYSEKLNALNRAILQKNIKLSTNAEYNLSAGLVVSGADMFSEFHAGIATQLTIELFPKNTHGNFPEYVKNKSIQRNTIEYQSIDRSAKEHIKYAESVIENCIEEIRLGNLSSLYSLSELLNEVINQQVSLSSLRYENIESTIQSFKKIEDLGISDLYARLAGASK